MAAIFSLALGIGVTVSIFSVVNAVAIAAEIRSARVSASLLPMIGADPILGRNFTLQEDSKGNDRVAILTDSLWRSRPRFVRSSPLLIRVKP